MKKLLIATTLALSIGAANAVPIITHSNDHSTYHQGYTDGKKHAYNNVGRAVVITGMVVIAGVIIYQLGRESRWTATRNGVGYRF